MPEYIHESLRALAVPIDTLKPDPRNARRRTESNREALAASLTQFGQRRPVVVQKQGMIIRAGNGLVEVAKTLGWTEVAAIVVDESDTEAAAYGIADNRTAELAVWDKAQLSEILSELQPIDDGAMVIGFTQDDLDKLLDDVFLTGLDTTLDEVKADREKKEAAAVSHEFKQFLVGLPPNDHKIVMAAIASAKEALETDSTAVALTEICEVYLS